MRNVLRLLTGLIGLLMLVIGLGFLLAPGQMMPQLGLFLSE